MKKHKLIIIIMIVIVLSTVLAIFIYKPRPIDKHATTTAAKPKADLSFAVLGDVHGGTHNFQKAVNDLYEINPSMDALVLNGDTVNEGTEQQYDLVEKFLSRNKDLLPPKIIKNIGNHEFFDYNIGMNSPQQVKTFINRYLEFSGEKKVYHDTWIKGYHFISLGSEDGKSKTTNSVEASISIEQQNWLRKKLGENYKRGKPIFVFLHQNLKPFWNWVGVKQSKQVTQILSEYPEVILFTSHTHSDLNASSVMTNGPFTMIHTGAIKYTLEFDVSSKGIIKAMKKKNYIKGLYVEVNGNNVVVKGRDIKERRWIFTKKLSKNIK